MSQQQSSADSAPMRSMTPQEEEAVQRSLLASGTPLYDLPQASAGSGEEWNPTDEQVRSAAMWYRHDLGLLTVAEAAKVKTEARLWLRSWQKEVAALRAEPQTASVLALEPFIEAMAGVPSGYADGRPFARVPNDARCPGTETTITFGQVRALIAALIRCQAESMKPHEAPEWLWYGEVGGKPIVTFGRWPKHGARWRYKLAEIQPTEHDNRSQATTRPQCGGES